MGAVFCFRKEENIMNLEEFKQLLKECGLPEEFSSKLGQIIRVVNYHDEKLKWLGARITTLTNKNAER